MSSSTVKKFAFNAVFVMVCSSLLLVKSQEECDTDVENMLATLVSPDEAPSMQLQALRNELIRRIKETMQREELENELLQYKRSMSSLARWNNLPGKRNLEALARAGYIRTLPADDPNNKRSLPNSENDEQHQNRQQPMSYFDDMNLYKRNVASIAKNGLKIYGKRNAASLLRQDRYINGMRVGHDENQTENPRDHYDDKRNIASIKAHYKQKFKRSVADNRMKRDADYYDAANEEYSAPVYQSLFDYDEDRDGGQEYQNPGKRFLGSVARSGWFRQPSKFIPTSKRHIGSLARLGWLPSLRTARRFNRSGRSTSSCDSRTSATDGEIDNNSISEDAILLNDKRFLLQPAVDRLLLEKVFAQSIPE